MPFFKNPFPGIKLVFGPLARNITRPEFNKGPRHCQPVSNKTVRLKFHTQSGRDTQFARKATALAIKRHFSLSRFWDNLIFVIWTHTVIHTFSRPMTAETHSDWLAVKLTTADWLTAEHWDWLAGSRECLGWEYCKMIILGKSDKWLNPLHLTGWQIGTLLNGLITKYTAADWLTAGIHCKWLASSWILRWTGN